MKLKNKIIIIVCLLHSICKGQTYFNNYYQNAYINLGATNVFMEPADSSFTFFSYTKDVAGGRQDFTTTRINKNGVLLLNKNHNINNYDYSAFLTGYRQFIPATKYSYLGASTNYSTSSSIVILNKISKNTLDTIFTKFYDDGVNFYYLNNYLKFNENKYYLIGNKSDLSGNSWPVIFHLDSNLNAINIITINTGLLNFSCNNAVYNPINKRILFGGNKNISSNQTNLYFIETDTLGVISNTTVINNNTIQGISQLKYSSFDNTYIFNGGLRTSKYGSNNMYRLNITKLNATNLNIIWSKTYGSAAITNNCNSMVINTDGSIVTCGRYADSTSLPLMNYDTKGVILKVNAVGDSLWMRQYNNYQTPPNPLNYFETFFGIEKTYDGGYIACGGVMNQPQGKAWVLKTDSLGCINVGCGSIINGTPTIISGINSQQKNEESQSISIYPNPATDVLNIELKNDTKDLKISIYNTLEQLVKKEELKQAQQGIGIAALPPGVYLVKVYSNINLVLTKKIIKQ